MCLFQSTLPWRERHFLKKVVCEVTIFQSTLPWRERRTRRYQQSSRNEISIHAPVKGATLFLWLHLEMIQFQSTLPWRERRFKGFLKAKTVGISIHAPVKGATLGPASPPWFWPRFQSTLPWRERQMQLSWYRSKYLFQSTLPWRERLHLNDAVFKCNNFNPRSREGSDAKKADLVALLQDFNPRSREGSDSLHFLLKISQFNFNPRSREGSDEGKAFIIRYHAIFQSTLPWRERRQCQILSLKLRFISIHAPVKGATTLSLPKKSTKPYFNPRSREGSDLRKWFKQWLKLLFQSTLPWRERRITIETLKVYRKFQSTLPWRERR